MKEGIDIKKLLATPYDDLIVEFPGYTRRELVAMKKAAQGLPVKPVQSTRSKTRAKFVAFLAKGRTERELKAKFEDFEALLKEDYEGYNLFKQRNLENEPVYILLPEVINEVVVQPKAWKHHIAKDDGRTQPYMMVQLPDHKESKVIIAPLFDVHFGNIGHRTEKFLSYIRWIKETPNIYAIVGGDLMENALDDGRGMSYDQKTNPEGQIGWMVQALAPIAHKILVAIPGNHEWRSYKKAGIDPLRFIADQLKIPYFDGPVFLDVLVFGYRRTFYVKHGEGNSQTKGGKMNAASKPRKFTGMVHFFVSGHVHDPVVMSETCVIPDPVNMRLTYPQQWTVIAPSFLRWEGTYAYRAGYPPPGTGGAICEISANGDYRATLR